MHELTEWQKELERLVAATYKETDSELFRTYKAALTEVKKELSAYIERYDQLSFSQKMQAERLLRAGTEIDAILSGTFEDVKTTLKKSSYDMAALGYNGAWYEMEGGHGLSLAMPGLDQPFVESAVNAPVAGKTLSQRLYQMRDQLAGRAQQSIVDGLVQGKGYQNIAAQIEQATEANYKQSLRIARTEGHRIRSITTEQAYSDARDLDIDLEKMWLATLDGKTRPEHAVLDGQIADKDGLFWSGGMTGAGLSAQAPGLFGNARMDINCRCTTIPVVDGMLPNQRRDNVTGELIPFQTYEKWAESSRYKQSLEIKEGRTDLKHFPTKVRDIPKGLSTRAAAEQFSIITKGQGFESGIMKDAKGTTIWSGDGSAHEVSPPRPRGDGWSFIHNHPSKNTFSWDDISKFEKDSMGEVVATAGDKMFVVRGTDYEVRGGFAEAYGNACGRSDYEAIKNGQNAIIEDRKAGRISDEEYRRLIKDPLARWSENATTWLNENADKYGVIFEVILL
jgi:hypothetical protein